MNISKSTWHYIFVFAVLVLAFALRVMTLEALSNTPYYDFLLPDERYYHNWATDIVQGRYSIVPFEYAPLPAYVMALVYAVLSIDIDHIRWLNIGLGSIGCLCVYLITREIMNRNWALVSLALSAFSAELLLYAAVPLKTTLSFLLFALLAYFLLRSLRSLSPLWFLLCGMVLGLAMHVRPNVLILLPLLIPVALHYGAFTYSNLRILVIGLIFLMGFCMTAAPIPLHGYNTTGKVSFLPVQSGFLFYCINTIHNPTPFYRPVPFASSHPDEQGDHFLIEASKREGKKLTAKQASRYWQRQVVEEAVADPGTMLKKGVQKFLVLFSFSENSDHYSIKVLGTIEPYFTFFLMKFWVFMLLGYTGLIVGYFRLRSNRSLTLLFLAYLFTLLVYSTGSRFFLPLLAVLIPASTWLIRHIVTSIGSRNYVAVIVVFGIGAALVFLGRLPLQGTGDVSKHYNNLAFIHKENNNLEAAQRLWRKSSESGQTYADIATLFLAGIDYTRFGPQKALEHLEAIPDSSFMAAAKHSTLGDIHKHHRNYQEAIAHYSESLAISYAQVRAREELIGILLKTDPPKAQEELHDLKWVKSFTMK